MMNAGLEVVGSYNHCSSGRPTIRSSELARPTSGLRIQNHRIAFATAGITAGR